MNENVEVDVTGNMKNSVKLPEKYPKDIFPIQKGSFIASAVSDGSGNFVLICYTDKSIKEVSEYYEEVIKNGQAMTTQNEETHYMSMGGIDKYIYTIDISEADGEMDYKTMYNISLVAGNVYEQMPESEEE